MGGILFPLLVFAIFAGIFGIERTQTDIALPAQTEAIAANDGQQFVAYRDAVYAYLEANPTYIGVVPSASLVAMGYQFSASFLAVTNNKITQVAAGTGRIVTCYSSLSPGAVTSALQITSNDASIGMASAGNWTSYAQGVSNTPQLLATSVTDGYVVSVIQKGP